MFPTQLIERELGESSDKARKHPMEFGKNKTCFFVKLF